MCVGSLGCLLGCLLRRQWGKFLANQTDWRQRLCVLCETHLGAILGLMRLEFLSFDVLEPSGGANHAGTRRGLTRFASSLPWDTGEV